MSGYYGECQLISQTTTRDERGVSGKRDIPRTVYCNEYTMSANAYFSAQAAGVHPAATLQIRRADYNGEQLVSYNGKLLSVVRESYTPDYVVLTLTERTGDRDG